jgi:arylsulfatase A-like enzyme
MSEFGGEIGDTASDSHSWWPPAQALRDGAPNVVVVLFDDLGFAQLGCYGSTIRTPCIDGLAERGLRFTNFHVPALCSPSRAALLTGRNHHAVGMGTVTDMATGFPGYDGSIPREAGFLSEVLRDAGYSTFAVGKWHLAPEPEVGPAGPFDSWPLQRGFERYYGFLPGKTNHWCPELTQDNHHVEREFDEGYHLTEDLVDRAIACVLDQRVGAPDRPFFLYLALGAVHSPHHAPREFIDRYEGKFDDGWDAVRQDWFERQRTLGLVPEETDLPLPNPGVPRWTELDGDARRFCARQQEVLAGFLEHTDAQLGRLVEFLERIDQLDNTLLLVLSDNGATQEGGRFGTSNQERGFNALSEDPADLAQLDALGGPDCMNLYPAGWGMAGNTPHRWYKHTTHGGGVRSPLIAHWPNGIARADAGAFRTQFAYITDIYPSVLEVAGIEPPQTLAHVPQMELHGTSFARALSDAAAPRQHRLQYFEIGGHRGIYVDGWKAVTHHARGDGLADDRWELYDLEADFSEAHDLADAEPERLEEMIALWWSEARRHHVLPVDDRRGERMAIPKVAAQRTEFVLYPGAAPLLRASAPDFRNRSYEIRAEIDDARDGDEGVLFASGGRHGGLSLYVHGARIVFDYNLAGTHHRLTSDEVRLQSIREVVVRFRKTGFLAGVVELSGDQRALGALELPATIGYRSFLEGAEAGCDRLTPVDPTYASPFAFTGALRRVVVTLGTDRRADYDIELAEHGG